MQTPPGAIVRKVYPGRYWPLRVRKLFKRPPDARLYFWCVIFPSKESMRAWATANRMDTAAVDSALGTGRGDFLATTQHRPSLIIPQEAGSPVRLPPLLGWLLFAEPNLSEDFILAHECLHAVLATRRAVLLLEAAEAEAGWPEEWEGRQARFEACVDQARTLTLRGSDADPDEEEHLAYSLGTTLRQVRIVKAAYLDGKACA